MPYRLRYAARQKQGVVIALSLPKNDKRQIREKVFDQIRIDDLKKEDGLDTLIAFLDKHLKKDDLVLRNLENLRISRDKMG